MKLRSCRRSGDWSDSKSDSGSRALVWTLFWLLIALAPLTTVAVTRAAGGEQGAAAAGNDTQVVVELAGPDRGGAIEIHPDPLIVDRERPQPVSWRPGTVARQAAATIEVRFDSASPFAHASASGSVDSLITLGSLRHGLDLESSSYTIRLLDAGGEAVAAGHGRVEIRHRRTAWPRRSYLIAGAACAVLLLFNYLERKPLTRTYED